MRGWTPLEDHIAVFFEPKQAHLYLPKKTVYAIAQRRKKYNVPGGQRKLKNKVARLVHEGRA